MRYLRSVLIGMAVFAMIVSLSGLAFAEMGKGACKVDKEACARSNKNFKRLCGGSSDIKPGI